jgi:hypothetical protein
MLIKESITRVQTTSVTVARRLVARLAVTLVCRLALLAGQHQMAGDGFVRIGRGRCALDRSRAALRQLGQNGEAAPIGGLVRCHEVLTIDLGINLAVVRSWVCAIWRREASDRATMPLEPWH